MSELKRGFGFWTILALLITAMVGTAMFFGTSLGAGLVGNSVLVCWVLVILSSVYVAACFGELTSMFPRAGGVYEYAKHAYGRFFSFLVGWVTWLMSTLGIVVVIIAAVEYLFPSQMSGSLFLGINPKLLIVVGLIIFLNIIAYLGVEASAAVVTVFALLTIGVFASLIFPGLLQADFSIIKNVFSQPAWLLFAAMFFMLEALMGWEEASFLAEETRNPEKTIPKALIVSTVIAGVLALLVALVSLGVVPWKQLAGLSAPVRGVAGLILGPSGAKIIGLGIVFSLIGSATGAVVSTPRLILGMARDKLFISQLAAVHKKRKTPYKAIIFQCLAAVLIAFLSAGRYEELLSLFTPIALLVYISVLLSVVILRFKLPDVKRPFKVWLGKLGPIIISLFYIAVVVAWVFVDKSALSVLGRILSLIFFAIPIYLLLIFFYNPDAIVGFSNSFAHLTLWFENLLLPKRIRREIIQIFEDLEHKSVLEFGAGVGTLTLHLAEAVGSKGKVFATELSKKNVHLLKKRLKKKGVSQVMVIHDEHQVNRVHPLVEEVDVVFSVGMMSYMQDVKKILTQMNRLLPNGGRILFMEYVNFFRFLPDADWLSDIDKLKELFRDAGFSVKIKKRHGLFWNYLIVYGIKSDEDVPVI